MKELKLQLTRAAFATWLQESLLLSIKGDTATIGAPNPYARDWLQHRLYPVIKRTFDREAGRELEMTFTVMEHKPKLPGPAP